MNSPAWRYALVAVLLLGACATAGDGSVSDLGLAPMEIVTTAVTATTQPSAPAPASTVAGTTTTAGPTATSTTSTTSTTTTTVDLSGLDDALDELEVLLDDLNTIESEGELP